MRVSGIDISASGMRAQRLKMDLISNNLANVDTTSAGQRTETRPDGSVLVRHVPYRRKIALFRPGIPGQSEKFGVSTPFVIDDDTDFRTEQNPNHPHSVKDDGADDFGRLYLPNVNPIVEMVDMISASRAYEANVTAIDVHKTMGSATLRILA
jgi:flagellar basal-body rod protein FlgC